jgi:ubiquinone/menaquinone biosynthesis C-methylase UbiE
MQFLNTQYVNSKRPAINQYLVYLYAKVNAKLVGNNILEIGSGPGISSEFIKDKKLTLTDFLPWPHGKIVGSVDASQLPYKDNTFDSVFLVNALHHMQYPVSALAESCRVAKIGGRVVIVEPYVNIFSYLIYKIFHNEKTTWRYKFPSNGKISHKSASDGEQSVLQALLKENIWIEFIQRHSKKVVKFNKFYFSPLSFFATGGLSRALPVPANLISALLILEEKLPKSFLKSISANQMLVIEVQ